MAFCLPLLNTQRFLQAIKDGSLDLAKLSEITDSTERRKLFEEYVGKEYAQDVNALFESKLLLKDWQQGMINFIKKTGGLTPPIKRDIISRIEKMDKVLNPTEDGAILQDLAAQKIGLKQVTPEEMTNILDFSNKVTETKEPYREMLDRMKTDGKTEKEINKEAMDKNSELYETRIKYGEALENMKEYIGELKSKEKIGIHDVIRHPFRSSTEGLYQIAGTTKSLLSTLDNSFHFRQGIKMLMSIRNADIWGKAFVESWKNIGKELKGTDAMRLIRIEGYSRPNALNGKYDALGSGAGLRVNSEEAFPSDLLTIIPGFGRIFKGAESAFNGAALRSRLDYADRLIELAEKQGINTLDKNEMHGVGDLVGAMTGRGNMKMTEKTSRIVNATLFSVKFFKSNLDVLTRPFYKGERETRFVQKQAAKNLATMILSMSAILAMAKLIDDKSVDFDPRNSRFGKIKIGATTFDITGGMGSIVTLASRIIPTMNKGKLGFYSKSQITDKINELNKKDKNGKPLYGAQTVMDIVDNFIQGKLSPVAGSVRDVWKGSDYNGNPTTPLSVAKNLVTPLPVATVEDLLKNPKAAPFILALIADGLGISTYTPPPTKKKKKSL